MTARRFEVRLGDRAYPELLAQSPDPPSVLYGIGDPAALEPGLAVVGARRATPCGLTVTERLAGYAAASGYGVISGAAIGCDQAAHRAALESRGRTVAVLPGGADITYPSGASRLLADICEAGAVVSEHPWGSVPKKWMFRTRNRIIAGLSVAVLVVEARVPSGTFSTADYALAAGRDVLAVPGSILSPESRGPNRLIRQGGTPIADTSDLAAELRALLGPPRLPALDWEPRELSDNDAVLRAVAAQAARPDDLAYSLGMDIIAVTKRLACLEAAGEVVRFRDGRYGVCV